MSDSYQVNLVCCYPVIAGHELKKPEWSDAKNREIFGKCANPHGHDYRLELHLVGNIHPETGLLINGYDVDAIVEPFIDNHLDHKFLNKDVEFFKTHQPTAEWIAIWLFESLKDLFPKHVTLKKVCVFETQNLAVDYPSL